MRESTFLEASEHLDTIRSGSSLDERIRGFAVAAARLVTDSRCEDVLVLEVRELADFSDYLVIATGTSPRQMSSVAEDLGELAEEAGFPRFGKESDEDASWIVLDFVDVVVHLFEATARAHYDLEMMWGDAPRVDWRR